MTHSRYRTEIDGLRALAICAVLANHFFETTFPNGYLGVDVFFVISGFVITASLQGRMNQPLGRFLAEFYARRVKRLFPALALMVLVTSLLITLVNPAPTTALKTGIFALFGLSNLYLYKDGSDYFGDGASLNPFTHTWSLGVEEQFYLVFPLIFWLAIRFFSIRIAIASILGLSLVSALAWGLMQAHSPLAAFYIVLFRFWEIGLGALVWLVQNKVPGTGRGWFVLKASAVVAAAAVVLLPVALDHTTSTVLAVLMTAVVLLLTGPRHPPLSVLQGTLPAYVGRVSYSLYLWHWPVVVMLKWTVGITPLTAGLGLAASFLLADLSYRYLEGPLRHARWAPGPAREILLGVGVLLGFSAILVGNGRYLKDYLYQGQQPALAARGVATLSAPYVSASGAIWSGIPCVITSNGDVGKVIKPAECTVGAPLESADRRVLVIGNSFSAAFAAAFDVGGSEGGPSTAFILTSSWGSAVVPEISIEGTQWALASDYYWKTVIPSLVSGLRAGDSVLIASDIASMSPALPASGSTERHKSFETGLRRLAQDLRARDVGLGMIGPLPFARDANCDPAMAVPQWFAPDARLCRFHSRRTTLERLAPLSEIFDRLVSEGVLNVVHVFDVFCPGDICGYINQDRVMMYRDMWSHPSVEAAQLVRPAIRRWLEAAPSGKQMGY